MNIDNIDLKTINHLLSQSLVEYIFFALDNDHPLNKNSTTIDLIENKSQFNSEEHFTMNAYCNHQSKKILVRNETETFNKLNSNLVINNKQLNCSHNFKLKKKWINFNDVSSSFEKLLKINLNEITLLERIEILKEVN
jgi:hypothetical protein